MCRCPRCRVFAEIDAEAVQREIAALSDQAALGRWAIAIAHVAERYRLDDADAARHVRLHAINGTGVVQ
jgi:hypothetical protein